MELGVVYPQIELGGNPRAFEHFGRSVEQMGFEHLLMYDHVIGAEHADRDPPLWGGYSEEDPFHDPFVAFSYMAGIAPKLKFVTGILILPQRQTVLVAKQAADLDLLSGERLTLGVGTGWNYVEYHALGQSFASRGKRLDEQIPYLRRLWKEPSVSFKGRFDAIERGGILPRPRREIPIYCGGFADVAYRRAAKIADGFIFSMGFEEFALPGLARIHELMREEGRSIEGFGAHNIMHGSGGRPLDLDEMTSALPRWRDIGGSKASLVTMQQGFTHVDQHIDYLAKVKAKLDGALS